MAWSGRPDQHRHNHPPTPARRTPTPSCPWLLLPSLLVLTLGAAVSYDAVRGMWGYRQGGGVARLVAENLAGKVAD